MVLYKEHTQLFEDFNWFWLDNLGRLPINIVRGRYGEEVRFSIRSIYVTSFSMLFLI